MRRRVFLCAAIVVVVLPGSAHAAQRLGVVVAPGFDLSDVIRSRSFGRRPVAVGLLVPDAGPDTSEARARAALVRGEVENSLRGTPSSGPSVIQLGPRPQRIVVGIPSGGVQKNNRRYVVFMPADRYGLFTSESTRIPGLVSIADIAPTALREEGALGVQPSSDPLGELRELDERIRDNGDSRMPGAAIAAGFVVLLALALPAAALLGLACALGANVVLGASGVSEPWVVWLVLGLATLVGGVALARTGRSRTAVGIVLVAVLAAYLVAMAIDQSWIALSPLGPTQNARFYGLSNLLETMLLVPALAGAALLARRFGPLAFLGTAALAVATIALSRFGADAGGALVLGAAYGALAIALTGGGRRALAAGIAGAVALASGVLFVDAHFGPSTHVGRSVGGGAGGVLSDLADRVVLSWERATAGWGVGLIVAAAIVALVVLVARLPRLRVGHEGRALLLSFAVALAASLVVNDSPLEVAVLGVVGYAALERYLVRLQSTSR